MRARLLVLALADLPLQPASASLAISAEPRAAGLRIPEQERDAREQERARQREQRRGS